MSKLNWDYTNLASFYDFRIDYAENIVKHICLETNLNSNEFVLEIGAGTGKLTKFLIEYGFNVEAVEPNPEMRKIGVEKIASERLNWHGLAAENVKFTENKFSSVWFGSSFNVINFEKTMDLVIPSLKLNSWLICLWNHRDLDNPIQKKIENIITSEIPNFEYGSRRSDPTKQLQDSKKFSEIKKLSLKFNSYPPKENFVQAWKSHGTLFRQCKNEIQFNKIIKKIADYIYSVEVLDVNIETNAWLAKFKN
jgi:SAM-dependent methyltransferase